MQNLPIVEKCSINQMDERGQEDYMYIYNIELQIY